MSGVLEQQGWMGDQMPSRKNSAAIIMFIRPFSSPLILLASNVPYPGSGISVALTSCLSVL